MATYRQQCIRLALQRVLAAHLSQDEARITPVCSTCRCAVLCSAAGSGVGPHQYNLIQDIKYYFILS